MATLILEGVSPFGLFGTALAAFIFCALAVGGGVGGGALYMPIYVLVTGDAHVAVPLAKVTTNGVGWSAFIFNMWMQHPHHSGPLIDYDVSLILEPLTLVGTIGGVILNVYSSTAVVLTLLVLVLTPTAWATLSKGLKQRQDARTCVDHASRGSGEIELSEQAAPSRSLSMSSRESQNAPNTPLAQTVSEQAQAILAEDMKQFPGHKILLMVLIWCAHAYGLYQAGGPTGILCGGWYPKVIVSIVITFHILFTLSWRRYMLQRQALRINLGIEHTCLYSIDKRSTVVYPVLSGGAGICAGGLGIAGGLIKGPLMLQWGLAPQASTATAIYMIMFTSSSTILQYALLGRLRVAPAVTFWLVGFSGGLVGSKAVAHIMKKCGQQWQITVGLGLLIVLSGLCMSLVSLLQVFGLVKREGQGGDICDNYQHTSH